MSPFPDGPGDGGPEVTDGQISAALDRIAALPRQNQEHERRAVLDRLDELAEQLVGRYHFADTELKQRIRTLTADLRGPSQPPTETG